MTDGKAWDQVLEFVRERALFWDSELREEMRDPQYGQIAAKREEAYWIYKELAEMAVAARTKGEG